MVENGALRRCRNDRALVDAEDGVMLKKFWARVMYTAGVAVALFAVGCGDDTGLDPDDLAGTWMATEAVMVNVANTGQTQDLISLGLSFTMVLRRDGSVTTTIDIGGGTDIDSGTWSISGNSLSMLIEGDVIEGTVRRDGDTMEVSLTSGLEWDFDGGGVEVPARFDLVMVRTG